MEYKLFIFDFDGTISDTFAHVNRLAEKIAPEFGIDISEIDENEIAKLKKMNFKEIHRYFGIKFYQLPFLIKRAKEEFGKIASEVELIPGMEEVIVQLYKQGKSLGILTSNNIENVEIVLKKHNLNYFEFVKESKKIGGKDKILKNIINQTGVKKEEVIYIGDEPRDIIAAKKSGISSAGVIWGLKSKEELQLEKPDYIYEKPQDILSIA